MAREPDERTCLLAGFTFSPVSRSEYPNPRDVTTSPSLRSRRLYSMA